MIVEDIEDTLRLEAALLAKATQNADGRAPKPLFILGSPRTGSTFLYQALAAGFELPYIANLTNDHFARTPIVGLSVQAAWPAFDQINPESSYGKAKGLMQPSEGSAVMQCWFGGGHPSEIVSTAPLPNATGHLQATFLAAEVLFGRPLLVKNAWNCFRVRALATLLPHAGFIWIRRDIATSAASDLAARYLTKGSPVEWNSATPRNVESLRARPYWQQVTENQFEFARAIATDFAALAPGRCATLWFEDLCRDPGTVLLQLGGQLAGLSGQTIQRILPARQVAQATQLDSLDQQRLESYVESEASRFAHCRYVR